MKQFISAARSRAFFATAIMVSILLVFILRSTDTAAVVEITEATTSSGIAELPQNTFAFPVIGTVAAADEVTVRARQAGVVSEIFVTEGDAAARGTTLSVILDPVLSARLSEQETASLIMQLREERVAVAERAGAAEAILNLRTASSTAAASLSASRHGTETAARLAELALETVQVTIPAVLRFVQDNTTYFTSESLTAYRSSLATLYGTQPSYLRIGPLSSGSTGTALLAKLETASTTDPAALALLLTDVKRALGDLRVVFADSVSEFLDRTELASNDPIYEGYLETQQSIVTLEAEVVSALNSLAQAADGATLTATTQAGIVALGEVGSATALEQDRLARELLAESSALAAAQNSVVRAALSLGIESAPFSGVVRTVLVEEGENVLPGTPLLRLVGSNAREVVVSVPSVLLSRVTVGLPVTLDGRVVGIVDRVAPPHEFGSGEVFVVLNEEFAVGTTLRAAIELPLQEKSERALAREYLGFAPAGPYVETSEGERIAVTVIYDAGKWLVVSGAVSTSTTLVPLVGIRL